MSANTLRVEPATLGTQYVETDHGAAARPAAPRRPSLTTTVPREFVHRAGVAEVMLTGWERADERRFAVSAQWPRGHIFFTSVNGCHDPLIAAETLRQIGSLLAHAEYGVPLGHHFLMWDLSLTVRPEHLLVGGAPASLDIDVVCEDVRMRRESLAGLRYTTVMRRAGQVVATGGASFTCMTSKVYQRLRADRLDGAGPQLALTAPTAPQNVGRVSPTDVVLTPVGRPDRWQLRVDTRHPVLFEHPVDHIPGMMLLEAARQAAVAAVDEDAMPLSITGEFSRYAELDTPCVIEARRLPRTDQGEVVQVSGRQDGEAVFCSTVTVAAPGT
ncbi:ScbA/BarX family gamma-butyrolactone biosynthesis protein [Streptomyces griseoincarnatus]|uniref:ScbA/BarX family gamma-butyrolactone biosynthesis protein n=1 Tax=Streptomyces tunisiensis TaxID=948699 RepID=UPI0036327789